MYIYNIYTYTVDGIKEGIHMDIIISNTSGIPIYEQITRQVKDMIITGALKEGEMLPSMRFLAKELRISLITTKRAYEELEKDGFIETRVGIGCFVKSKNVELIREQMLCKIEEAFEEAVSKAELCDLKLPELQDILKLVYEDYHEKK